MSVLNAHLEQISLSCQGIDALPFPPPKIFTNALLHNDNITSLIRDTEPHERALFSVPPPPPPATAQEPEQQQQLQQQQQQNKSGEGRRRTVFAVSSGEVTTGGGGHAGRPTARRNTAVAAVLGGELHGQLSLSRHQHHQHQYQQHRQRRTSGDPGRGDVDVEVLLRGADKLCGVYALPGARERIAALRAAWARNGSTLAYYEAKVAEQSESLGRMNRSHWMDEDEEEEVDEVEQEEEDQDQQAGQDGATTAEAMTEDDLRAEEEEVRELERKKRELQLRLRTMEKDLSGLL